MRELLGAAIWISSGIRKLVAVPIVLMSEGYHSGLQRHASTLKGPQICNMNMMPKP